MRYSNATLETVSPKIRELLKVNAEVIEVKDKDTDYLKKKLIIKKGLFMYGITGSGKTYTLYAINKNLRAKHVKTSGIENWVELLTEVKDRLAEKLSIKYTIDNITSSDCVFLDDVGAEKSTEWVQEIFYLIIDRCYRNEKTLFISTNLSLEDFTARYGERLLSRISEMCEVYQMENEDKRLN